ncbi:DoxX family protein [bacterium]|nr:DoxX family protein [bacterium]|tara:strand:- start:4578 stop:5072 length:495 start_codon:yes stop_codon:yes gene_type:complete
MRESEDLGGTGNGDIVHRCAILLGDSFLSHILMSALSSFAQKNADSYYFIFRLLVGFLFLQQGMQKVGLLEGEFAVQGFVGFVGLCELAGGAAIFVGLWSRLVAGLGTVLMLGAYVSRHMGNGTLPIENRGELALLYVACFLVLFVHGSGTMSLEKKLTKKERF